MASITAPDQAHSSNPAQLPSPSRNGHHQQTKPTPNLTTPRTALFDDDEPSETDTASTTTSASQEQEAISPATISSPPYWLQTHTSNNLRVTSTHHQSAQGGNSHSRGLSNTSVESVLPPGAITLQDNESETQPHSPGTDRNKACWARSVQVVDYVHVNGSTTNLGAFTVWNIKVETLTGAKINIRKRYSEFDDLRRKLVQTFPNFEAAVPVLPPKSVLNKFKPKFLEKRRAGLQYFLNCILLNPEFSGSPVLKEFLFT